MKSGTVYLHNEAYLRYQVNYNRNVVYLVQCEFYAMLFVAEIYVQYVHSAMYAVSSL